MKIYYRLFKIALLLTAGSGIGYFIVHEWFKIQTEYGLRPHPSQEYFQHFHVLFSPWLILIVGALIPIHLLPKLKQSLKRRSGLPLIVLFSLMVVSGPLLQFGFEGLLKEVLEWIHILSGGLFVILFLIHSKKSIA